MSDPVKNFEIEDVLSSIRRLVSEGERQRPQAQSSAAPDAARDVPEEAAGMSDLAAPAASAHEGPDQQPPGRFVLTPALRVVEASDMAPGGAVDGNMQAARPDATDSNAADTVPPQGAADVMGEAPFATPDDKGEAMAPIAADADIGANTPASAGRLSLLDTIAELEAAVTYQSDEWEPDGSEEVPVVDWASTRADPNAFLRNLSGLRTVGGDGTRQRPVPEASRTTDLPVEASDDTPAPTFRHMQHDDILWAAQVLGGAPAPQTADPDTAVAAAQAGSTADTAPETTPYAGPYAGPDTGSVQAEDRTATDGGLAEDLARAPEPVFDRAADGVMADDADMTALIDEEMLRQLVIEVVRQELQGTLGERITRNVRKLVRREIYRVLSSQEFD